MGERRDWRCDRQSQRGWARYRPDEPPAEHRPAGQTRGAREQPWDGPAAVRSFDRFAPHARLTPMRRGQRYAGLADVAQALLRDRVRDTARAGGGHAAGVLAGSAVQSISCRRTAASTSDASSPSNSAAAGQHLVEHDSRRPRCRRACRPPCRAPARAPCRPPCRGSSRARSACAVSVGEFARSSRRTRPAGSSAFARPKSSTLTVPSGRTLTLAGLRSR